MEMILTGMASAKMPHPWDVPDDKGVTGSAGDLAGTEKIASTKE
ncbi:hypothetical protein DES53_105121 [Roseimicrobium gellanilyticum]|uniref:Uncharacterized protein n=1 Tax=Roseimicrobium gellanilyticum TaxID=748857 RepID=A0A366HN17_9BACT|nr:hypothetical protein [Roseimicrobium gellanilyticum]RBP43722.1 hypothetical protein DES53_105121 [Roseimicrobium gellanilyticum]